jgi:hypothetical protein
MAGGVVAQVIECLPSNHEAQFKTQYLKKKKKNYNNGNTQSIKGGTERQILGSVNLKIG